MRLRLISAVLITLTFLSAPIAAREYSAEEYKYPYKDPYLATATTAVLIDDTSSNKAPSSIIHVAGLRGRERLPSLESRGNVSLALYKQDRPAPLMFVIPGLGSNPYFGVAPYLAKLFYREGFHVVVLPSTLSWNFALAASRSGAPGYTPSDARDLYEVMQKTLRLLRSSEKMKISSTNVVAISLGALVGAHLSIIDQTEHRIGISKFLLINPPVDLAYAAQKIDEWNGLAKSMGEEQAKAVMAKAIAVVDSLSDQNPDDPATFDKAGEKFAPFTKENLEFLIAENLQSQLAELIYVTQVIQDQKLLKAPRNDKRARLAEAKNFTLADYNRKIALPLWQRQDHGATLPSMLERGSLTPILGQLAANPRVHIMHNADDFFVQSSSFDLLKETLGDQLTLYPTGGHLGNLWYPDNKEFALSYFRNGMVSGAVTTKQVSEVKSKALVAPTR